MGIETGIAWTDHTFNPWWGCVKISPACTNCYAATFDKRVGGDHAGGSHWGPGSTRRLFGDKHWDEPHKWNAVAEKDRHGESLLGDGLPDGGERDRMEARVVGNGDERGDGAPASPSPIPRG